MVGSSGSTMRRNPSKKERGHDFYRTPVEAALWPLLALEGSRISDLSSVYEPACGDGGLVIEMRRRGLTVHASDIVDRGCPDSGKRIDFVKDGLSYFEMMGGVAASAGVITNPPYGHLMLPFAQISVDHFEYVALLLPSTFLWSERRSRLLNKRPPSRAIVFSRRLPRMHREGHEGAKNESPAGDHAWYIWDTQHVGGTTWKFIDWKDERTWQATTTNLIHLPPHGCESLLNEASLPMVMSMKEISPMSSRKTLNTTHNVIFSQELEGGAMHYDLHNGQTIDLFGQEVAPASHSARQVNAKENQTSGTCGPCGSISSKSAALQSFLESKLKARLPTAGLMIAPMTWKAKATPSHRPYCQLAVSGHRTAATDCGLWATPNTMDNLPPRSREAMERQFSTTRKGRTAPANLREQVVPAMWPTPNALPATSDVNLTCSGDKRTTPNKLGWAVSVCLWPTPASRDHKDTGDLSKSQFRQDGKERNDTLGRVAYSSTAPMENKGSLNPQFPCWLMGYPTEWDVCGAMVTR